MISIKAIFVFLVVSNLFALGVITYNYFTLPRPEGNSVAQQGDTPSLSLSTQIDKPKFILDIKYSFDNPKLAAKALAQLDTFTPVPTSYFSKKDDSEAMKYGQAYFGLAESPDYCAKNREAFTENPDIVFEQNHFMTDAAGKSLVRSKVIQEIGHDVHPNIHPNMPEPQKNDFIYTLNRELSNFFTTSDMYLYKQIGQDFSCLAQESNHIPGHSALENKDVLATSLTKYAKKFATKPACFNYDSLFPETWVLNDKTQCQEFFKYIDTPAFRKQRLERGGISLIRKTISETGDKTDVRPVNAEEEETLRSVYKEGASCGTVKKNQIIQYYVYNPLTINGKKFDFRMFMLAASTNPLIVYYHDGFLRLAVDSTDSEAASSFLSSLAPDVKYEVMSFNDLQSHLLKKGLITDSNWLDNYLRPELKKAMVHLMKMSSTAFLKKSSIYELFAVDFIMDSDLKLWFMEVDANPEFVGANDENEKFLVKMLKDHFEVVNGLLKSRMKRVVNYINRQMKDKQIYENNKEAAFKSLEQKTKEFNEVSKNYWEPEYEPGKQNGFKKIIDENFFGVQRNSWILAKECL